MTHGAQILDNPISGERFIFPATAAETDGEVFTFDLVVGPDGRVPGGHVHPKQEERFEILAGVMRFWRGLRSIVAGPGDAVVIPPTTYHRFANAGNEPAHVRVVVRPQLRMKQLFETAVALAEEGRTLRTGMPKPLDLALFMREFREEIEAPVTPGLVRALMAPLAWLGTKRGLDARYRSPQHPITRAPAPVRPGTGRSSGVAPHPSRPSSTRGARRPRSHR